MQTDPNDMAAKAKLSLNFLDYIAAPLWKTIAENLFPNLSLNIRYMNENRKYWQTLHEQSVAKQQAEAAAAAPASATGPSPGVPAITVTPASH